MWRISALIVAFILTVLVPTAQAQMHVTVQTDRVLIGSAGEFISRRLDLPNRLIVGAGAVEILPVDSSWDYIEVGGTLRCDPTHDTTLRFTHFIVLPGGVNECGTVANPIPANRRVIFIVRDVPIDTTKDPFQWGNGLVNFGTQTRVGSEKTAWVETTSSIANGARTTILASAPVGWRVGDELLIVDTATPRLVNKVVVPRRESTVTIATITGTILTFSKPLDFEHNNITDPQGVVKLHPRIANLTRNLVLRSENPDGARGHTADIGHGAVSNVRYNEFIGLGRTKNEPLNDTVGTTIGNNQRGKYAFHFHHLESSAQSAVIGNSFVGLGSPISKWAIALHNTSDVIVESNVVVDFPGASIVTEDGNEVRNIFRKNFVAYSLGNLSETDTFQQAFDADTNMLRNCPGCDGTGYWFHGVMNVFDKNESWNTFGNGLDLFNQRHPSGIMYPSQVGGPADTPVDHFKMVPIQFTDNVTAGNVVTGFELWGIKPYPYERLISANNFVQGIYAPSSDGTALSLKDPTIICDSVRPLPERDLPIGIFSNDGYVGSFDMVGGQVAGCHTGLKGGGSLAGTNITRTIMQNDVDIDTVQRHLLLDNMMFLPLGNTPHQFIQVTSLGLGTEEGKVWNGTDSLPVVGLNMFLRNQGSDLIAKNWQGTGQDYQFFFKQSLSQNPSWYSAYGQHAYNPPVKGLTGQQAWDQFGIGYGGDVLKEADAVDLDGLIYGRARNGTSVLLGPPRAILTFPTTREPAVLEGDFHDVVYAYALLTGEGSAASRAALVSIDGADPFSIDFGESDFRTFGIQGPAVAPGTHTVTMWRTKKDVPLEALGAGYTGQYCVGACGAPPPVDVCPNIPGVQAAVPAGMMLVNGQCVTTPPTTVNVPNVVGKTQGEANSSIVAVGLVLGAVTNANSATVPLGQIISQTPPATTNVNTGTSVAIVVSLGPIVIPPMPGQRICIVEGIKIVSCTPELVKQ